MKGNGTPKTNRPKTDRGQMARMHQALGLPKGQQPPKYMKDLMKNEVKGPKDG